VGWKIAATSTAGQRHLDVSGPLAGRLLADNACACWFMPGTPAPAGWRDLDLAAHSVALFRNGEPAGTGVGANVLGDPRLALTWLANDRGRFGEFLRAGQIVTTGTCATPMALEDGLEMMADFGVIGRISARFAE